MKITIRIPKYDPLKVEHYTNADGETITLVGGLESEWEVGYQISSFIDKNALCIQANKNGLLSLANQCLSLAQENVHDGNHIHLDEWNAYDDDSSEEIIIEKTQDPNKYIK
jgi:hypothetical protein